MSSDGSKTMTAVPRHPPHDALRRGSTGNFQEAGPHTRPLSGQPPGAGNSSVLIISTRFQRRQDRLPSGESVIRPVCGAARGRRR